MAENEKDQASESLEGDLDLTKSDTDDVVGGMQHGPHKERTHTHKGPREERLEL